MKYVVLILVLLVGCAAHRYENTLNAWVGVTVDQLVDTWGPPTNIYDNGTGDTFYVWHTEGPSYTRNGWIYTPHCDTTFTVRTTVITSWSYKGNSCHGI